MEVQAEVENITLLTAYSSIAQDKQQGLQPEMVRPLDGVHNVKGGSQSTRWWGTIR